MEHLILRSIAGVLRRVYASLLQPLQQVLVFFGQRSGLQDVIVAPLRGEEFVLVLVDPLDEAAVAFDQVWLLALLLPLRLILAEVRQPRSPAAALQLPLTLRTARLRDAQRGASHQPNTHTWGVKALPGLLSESMFLRNPYSRLSLKSRLHIVHRHVFIFN